MVSKEKAKILTIIIPSYNTFQFIDKNLPCYIDKELIDNISVLLIDDGSNDGATLKKLEEYSSKYPNLFQTYSKQNGGHGSVINYGVSLVKTVFFKIVDGDDELDPTSLKKVVKYLKTSKDDLLLTDFVEVFDKTRRKKILFSGFYLKTFCQPRIETSMKVDQLINYDICFHSSIFRTSLWTKNAIKIREGAYYDDQEYFLFPLPFVKTFSYINVPLYIYHLGVSGQSISIQSMTKHFSDYQKILDDIIRFYINLNESTNPSTREVIKRKTIQLIHNFYRTCLQIRKKYSEKRSIFLIQDSKIKTNKILFMETNNIKLIHILRASNFHFLFFWSIILNLWSFFKKN